MGINRTKKGFTLIELLVVIAVIAMLLGILVPALAKVKRTAQSLICGTNLKSYGTAFQAYSGDNKDKAPFMASWLYSQQTITNAETNLGLAKGCMWHYDKPDGSLWPYLSSNKVHMCPVFKGYADKMGKDGCPNAASHSARTPFVPTYSYAINFFLGFDWSVYITLPTGSAYSDMLAKEISLKLSKVKSPGRCFAFSEENLWSVGHRESDLQDQELASKIYSASYLNDNFLWLNANKDKPDDATDNVATYHGVSESRQNEGKANLVFVDGHVELMPGDAGREAYLNYGRPYSGHESMNIW